MLHKASVRFLQIIDGITFTETSNKKQTKRSDGLLQKACDIKSQDL